MRLRAFHIGLGLLAIGLLSSCASKGKAPAAPAAPAAIALPGGEGGIGFDDLRYSEALHQVLVPAGRSGRLDLVDPSTHAVVSIPGFSTKPEFTEGEHDDGITSVAEGAGLLFVTDRTSEVLYMVDPTSHTIVGQGALSASSDYVRWLDSSQELWVSEPDSERVEVLHFAAKPEPHVESVGKIEVPEGPESLVLDPKRGRAYTHAGAGTTVAIDLGTHAIVASWPNGCKEPSGMALDTERGFLFVACSEGGVQVLDVATGKHLGGLDLGGGIDIISYSPELGHLYVPSEETATLATIGVSREGALTLLGTTPATKDSHCVAAAGQVFFCDPAHGRLLVAVDHYPPSPR